MHFKIFAFTLAVASVPFMGCDRSERSVQVQAVPDYSQYGVVTAPQTGHLLDQPNVEGQLGVTTETVASAPEGTDRLGDKPADAPAQNEEQAAPQPDATAEPAVAE